MTYRRDVTASADVRRHSRPAVGHGAVLFTLGLCISLLLCGLSFVGSPEAQAAAKGIEDHRLESVNPDPLLVDEIVTEMAGGGLRASLTRISIDWSALEPAQGQYNEAYFASLDSTISKLHDAGLRVILTEHGVPRWASDRSLWASPPSRIYTKNVYQSFYAPSADGIRAFGRLGAELASRLGKYGVLYECWNEPNLYYFLYPQAKPGASYFGPRTYLNMLKAFSGGIKSVLPGGTSTVIAGANSPRGGNNAGGTSPQRFAGYLKSHGADAYFDAYSHHPYQTGGSKSVAPNRPPYNTRNTVTLYNIKQLLRLFPKKPFYLTEYGYSTYQTNIGLVRVSEKQQALYLRQAYSLVRKHSQIKALVWFLIRDSGPYRKTTQRNYVYTGLRKYGGARKLSWYAFAGANRLTLSAPGSVRRSRFFSVSGVLTGRMGPLAGKRLILQSRSPSQATWSTLKSTSTTSTGGYSFRFLRQKVTKYYRVRWDGVRDSARRTVRVR